MAPASHPSASAAARLRDQLFRGDDPTPAMVEDWLTDALTTDVINEITAADILVALRSRGESAAVLAAAAAAIRRTLLPFGDAPATAIDTCGTGGDGVDTFNISTATAFVVAACGVPVVKHGNRAATSRTGSFDVLDALGITGWRDIAWSRRTFRGHGIALCFAPNHYPALARFAALRRRLGTKTLFNFVGPLLNPAGTRRQLIGVGDASMVRPMAEALVSGGIERAAVVRGDDGLDEVTLGSPTRLIELRDGKPHERTLTPADFGLPPDTSSSLKVADAEESANVIRRVVGGDLGPARDIVLANAALALTIADRARTLREGVAVAATAIDSGRAANLVESLRALK